MSEFPDLDWRHPDFPIEEIVGITGTRPDGAEVSILGFPGDLPKGAISYYVWLDGHGPAEPDKQTFNLGGDRIGGSRTVCDVPECRKCIRGYKRELNFPRYKYEEEVFV